MCLVAAFACALKLIWFGAGPCRDNVWRRSQATAPIRARRGSLAGFAQIINVFREKAKGAAVALAYCTGHAMQLEAQNWLMPINTRVAQEHGLMAHD